MFKRIAATFAGLAAIFAFLPFAANAQVNLKAGDLIKIAGNPSVYYYGSDFKRYVFPNDKTYRTWYADFSSVKVITAEQLAFLPIGGNVTYRPATRLVKVTTDPKVYAVSKNGILRALASEQVAASLYGTHWNQMVDDVPDAFFVNYRVGTAIANPADYNKPGLSAGVPSIDVDKRLVAPPAGYVDVIQNVGFSPNAVTVTKGTAVTWIAMDDSMPTVASNPHPTHTDIPDFETATIPMGQTWSFVFAQTGTWGYHNHNFPDQGGTVTVK